MNKAEKEGWGYFLGYAALGTAMVMGGAAVYWLYKGVMYLFEHITWV